MVFPNMKSRNIKYYSEIDIIKGLAILLIVFGHSICEFPINLHSMLPNVLPTCLAEFNLHLFFIVSGFLFSFNDDWTTFLTKKLSRLIIPYIVFGIVSTTLRILFSSFTHSGAPTLIEALFRILSGRTYWFLYVLFFILITCRLTNFLRLKHEYALAVLTGIFILSYIVLRQTNLCPTNAFMRYIFFLPFFSLGYFLKKRYLSVKTFSDKYKIILFALFSLLFTINNISPYSHTSFIFTYINALLGCSAIWCLGLIIDSINRTPKLRMLFTHFGKYSLQYYTNHLLIMLLCYYSVFYMNFSNPWICLGIVFLSALAISWTMLLIEKQWSWSRYLCGLR